MTTHILIHTTTDPITVATAPVNGYPRRRSTGDPATYRAPDNYAYVPDLPRPDYDPATQRIQRVAPTLDGWGWEVLDLTPEEIAARTVPDAVPRHALKIAMLREDPESVGQVNAAIAAMPEAQRLEADISWQEAPNIRRSAVLVSQLAGVLGWDDARVDRVFTAAQAVSDEIAG